jgi:hypothetical protein
MISSFIINKKKLNSQNVSIFLVYLTTHSILLSQDSLLGGNTLATFKLTICTMLLVSCLFHNLPVANCTQQDLPGTHCDTTGISQNLCKHSVLMANEFKHRLHYQISCKCTTSNCTHLYVINQWPQFGAEQVAQIV